MSREKIIILDFGSQYAHLIAKRFRLQGYYSEIALPSVAVTDTLFEGARGVVLSGGPASVYEEHIPEFNQAVFDLDIPILGLCYGHQLLCSYYGGTVEKTPVGEFGFAHLESSSSRSPLFLPSLLPAQVWMSHQDSVTRLPPDFEVIGFTANCPYAAVQNLSRKRFGLQFHAEVKDTLCGGEIFAAFAEYCGMSRNWDQNQVLETISADIVKIAGDRNVLLFLSGGVDSTVAFALLNRVLGQKRVLGLHIDNGFMRKNESAVIAQRYKACGFSNFIVENSCERFLEAVAGLSDPQEKRKAVGETFIAVRNEVVRHLELNEDNWLLGQGTLYPDIIESGGTKNAHVIKTHHNRVEGIQTLIEQGLIIEPLKDLYKDEVRVLGKKLGLADELVFRHPFPGPGLSINVLCYTGKFTDEQEFVVAQKVLSATEDEVRTRLGSSGSCFASCGVLPVKSVGVQGDFRTYRYPAVLRFGNILRDFLDWDSLDSVSSYITNTVKDVNRTVLALYEKEGCVLRKGYCTADRLDQTREVDAFVLDELKKTGWYTRLFQHLTVNLPYATEKNHCSIVLRPVVSEDVMTARFAHLDIVLLKNIICGIEALGFVDALYYDLTNKPPATFGWE